MVIHRNVIQRNVIGGVSSPPGGVNRGFCRSLILLAGFIALSAGGAFAAVTGTISGTIMDPSGGVIPKAMVTVTNVAQGVKTNTTTDPKGVFVFPSLPVGTYDVHVEAPGFKPQDKAKLVVDLDSTQEVNL